MCKLVKPLEIEEVTGYKVVIKRGKRYYSPATGIEYVAGKAVKDPTRISEKTALKNHDSNFVHPKLMIYQSGHAFQRTMIGRTAVFEFKISAEDVLSYLEELRTKAVIVKMTISKELMKGYYGMENVYAGKFINSIEEVKE